MNVEWKEIYYTVNGEVFDYRGHYAVSNTGKVKNVNTNKLKVLGEDKDGYLTVSLWKNGKEKNLKVHRLVAFMFIDGHFGGAVVNHKDENKSNNIVTNLEWCTIAYNNTYNDGHKRRRKKVLLFTLNGEYVRDFSSVEEAAKYFCKSSGNLVSHLKGRQKTFSGHILKYAEDK